MLHTLSTTNNRGKKRVGRGGNRGKTAGRGHKGQKSRSGRSIRPAMRDELQRMPKLRGHNKNRARGVRTDKHTKTITLTMLERYCNAGDIVTPNLLVNKKAIPQYNGKTPKIRIVGTGELTKALVFRSSLCPMTKSAREKIEAVKGVIK